MNRIRARMHIVSVLIGLVFFATSNQSVHATFHLWDITEVYSNADGTLQFIEWFTTLNSQQSLADHAATSNSSAYTFPNSLSSSLTGGQHFLMATAGFAALPGAPTPDYIMPDNFINTAGDTLQLRTTPISTVWDTFAFGPEELPTNGTDSLVCSPHAGISTCLSTAVEVNSPTNFAGETGSVTPPCPADLDGDGDVDVLDFASFQVQFTGPLVTFEWVTVGNSGNAADPLNEDSRPGIGSVTNVYRMAKHEVTNGQYTEFLNAAAATDPRALYSTQMGSDPRGGITRSGSSGSFTYSFKADMDNKPVNYLSLFDAMRFVNWLHNGQPTGVQDASTTEDGVYAISDGLSETRAGDAQFFIPAENEWYKAAYHQPSAEGGDLDNFWLYPTAANTVPTVATANATGDISNPGVNVANYNWGADWNGLDGNLTTVGSAGADSESFYGTSDQGGNVYEWNDTLATDSLLCVNGGAWGGAEGSQQSSTLSRAGPSAHACTIGFRVASPVFICSADLNDDGDVDLLDFESFHVQITGPQ